MIMHKISNESDKKENPNVCKGKLRMDLSAFRAKQPRFKNQFFLQLNNANQNASNM